MTMALHELDSFVRKFLSLVCGHLAVMPVYRCNQKQDAAGLQVCRFTVLQVYRFAGLQVCRFAGLQVNRLTGLQENYRIQEYIL